MQHSYFKIRNPWNFKPHRFETGPPFIRSSFHDNHFLLKINKLADQEFFEFYNFHLRHYIDNFNGKEQDFHRYVSDIVSTRIAVLKLVDPFSRKSLRARNQIEQLRAFQKLLASIDIWNSSHALEVVIAEMNEEITGLKAQVTTLEGQLQTLRQFEPSSRIDVRDKYLPTFIDLLHQLQRLTLPDERKLFNFQGQSAWYKLLSKYFTHNRKPIPIETARHYFPVQKDAQMIKGSQVPTDLRLFKIMLTKPKPAK